jgi:Protein of unknown function (DUF4229)
MKEFTVYTLARIAMFVASLVLIGGVWWLLSGQEPPLLWPLLLAAAVSAVGSYYLLAGPRERFAALVDTRATNMARRLEEQRSKEDRD